MQGTPNAQGRRSQWGHLDRGDCSKEWTNQTQDITQKSGEIPHKTTPAKTRCSGLTASSTATPRPRKFQSVSKVAMRTRLAVPGHVAYGGLDSTAPVLGIHRMYAVRKSLAI